MLYWNWGLFKWKGIKDNKLLIVLHGNKERYIFLFYFGGSKCPNAIPEIGNCRGTHVHNPRPLLPYSPSRLHFPWWFLVLPALRNTWEVLTIPITHVKRLPMSNQLDFPLIMAKPHSCVCVWLTARYLEQEARRCRSVFTLLTAVEQVPSKQLVLNTF